MKKLLGILVIGLLFCSIGYAKTKITEVKRSVKAVSYTHLTLPTKA